MSKSSHDHPLNGKPTPAEIFRVFRETTIASISGLKLLLDECADLRAELVAAHNRTNDGNGEAHGIFSARQKSRIVELRDAAQAMEALVIELPCGANDERIGDKNIGKAPVNLNTPVKALDDAPSTNRWNHNRRSRSTQVKGRLPTSAGV